MFHPRMCVLAHLLTLIFDILVWWNVIIIHLSVCKQQHGKLIENFVIWNRNATLIGVVHCILGISALYLDIWGISDVVNFNFDTCNSKRAVLKHCSCEDCLFNYCMGMWNYVHCALHLSLLDVALKNCFQFH